MDYVLVLAGRIAGFAGILLCVVAVISRLLGAFNIAGIWVGTLLQGGTAAIVMGCFLLLLGPTRSR